MFNTELPTTFTHGEKEHPFHSDFREWMRFESLISNGDIPKLVRMPLAVNLIFAGNPPEDIQKAFEFIQWFYHGGRPAHKSKRQNMESRRVYDYEYDFEYIYAAFIELYGIDLVDIEYLHWWKFLALFKGLHDCRMTDIMGYRGAKISKDMPNERKAFLLDMKDFYALPVSLAERRRIEAAKNFLGKK